MKIEIKSAICGWYDAKIKTHKEEEIKFFAPPNTLEWEINRWLSSNGYQITNVKKSSNFSFNSTFIIKNLLLKIHPSKIPII